MRDPTESFPSGRKAGHISDKPRSRGWLLKPCAWARNRPRAHCNCRRRGVAAVGSRSLRNPIARRASAATFGEYRSMKASSCAWAFILQSIIETADSCQGRCRTRFRTGEARPRGYIECSTRAARLSGARGCGCRARLDRCRALGPAAAARRRVGGGSAASHGSPRLAPPPPRRRARRSPYRYVHCVASVSGPPTIIWHRSPRSCGWSCPPPAASMVPAS